MYCVIPENTCIHTYPMEIHCKFKRVGRVSNYANFFKEKLMKLKLEIPEGLGGGVKPPVGGGMDIF